MFLKSLQMPIPEHLQITPHNLGFLAPYPASRGESRAEPVTNWRINQKSAGFHLDDDRTANMAQIKPQQNERKNVELLR
jgi:hypothetical protein